MNQKSTLKKLLSVLLCLAMLASYLPISALRASAAGSTVITVADPSTKDGWKQFFDNGTNLNTENAGGVWTDKSVFTDASAFSNITTDSRGNRVSITMNGKNSFLVALSAIASNMSVTGQASTPTDTMLVLDVSGSMNDNAGNNDVAEELAEAANSTIHALLTANPENRVGVVLYSGTSSSSTNSDAAITVLPLGRYTTGSDNEYLNYELETETTGGGRPGGGNQTTTTETICLDSDVCYEGTSTKPTAREKEVVGATYIQKGLVEAMEQFTASTNETTVNGVTRKPVLVLMSDGAPTLSTTNFTDPGQYNLGNGQASSTNAAQGFVTQLTAAYTKYQIEDKYKTDALFYTVGLGTTGDQVATSVLDPANSNSGIDEFWTSYNKASVGGTVTVEEGDNWWDDDLKVTKIASALEQNYVDKYFGVSGDLASGLKEAFESITSDIQLQSKYYPTLIGDNEELSGYVSFVDKIGAYMNVTDVKGILLHEQLFSGADLAHNFVTGGGDLGTVENPTALGDEMVFAVRERLGLPDNETARTLISLAYQYGQLSYTDENNYSNYIGWYANADGEFLGFWHEGITTMHDPSDPTLTDATRPAFIIKSYGYLGDTDPSHGVAASDMMYATVQVRHNIVTGEELVTFAVPAALIPVVSYEVTLDENGDLEALDCTGADYPIRLLYEVALDESINELTVGDIVSSDYLNVQPQNSSKPNVNADGSINFYTNRYDIDGNVGYGTPNTYSYFNPSRQNDKYYYTENAPIYMDDQGTLYTGSTSPADYSGTLYRAYVVYEKTGNTLNTKTVYRPLSDRARATAVQADGATSWYIPKGNVHVNLDGYHMLKALNATGTLQWSNEPFVDATNHSVNDTGYNFIVGASLGNNGKLTLTPATGIKLTKSLAAGFTSNETFTFKVDGNITNAQVVRLDADGNEVSRTDLASDGLVALKANETVYIVGLSAGTYYVTEQIPAGSDYKVSAVTIDGLSIPSTQAPVTLSAQDITDVVFTNAAKLYGDLIVSKDVTHPYDTPPAELTGKPFVIYVDLGSELANKEFTTDGHDGYTTVTADANGVITLYLRDGESITIQDIPENTAYTVTENLSDSTIGGVSYSYKGYSNTTGTITGTIDSNGTDTVGVVNKFEPNSTVSEIIFKINKAVEETGTAQYDKDYSFQFKLEQYDPDTGIYTQIGSTVELKDGGTYSFAPLTPKAIGVYHYKVSEIIPTDEADRHEHISYDATTGRIVVFVTDENADGNLEYVVKDYVTNELLVADGDGDYSFEKTFTNLYTEDLDPTYVEFTVDKNIVDSHNMGISEAGFLFQLTEVNADGTAKTGGQFFERRTQLVSGHGKATFHLPITTEGTWYYLLTEFEPTINPIAGMTYDPTTYYVTVTAEADATVNTKLNTSYKITTDSFDGTVIAGTDVNTTAEFLNTVTMNPGSLTLSANKVLNGREPIGNEFTFTLTETDGSFATATGYADSKTVGKGTVSFNAITYTKAGTYYYVIKETAGSAGGMSYDSAEYHVTVTVAADGDNLVATPAITKLGAGTVAADQITFTNTYTITGHAEVTLQGFKNLTGRVLLNEEFTFTMTEVADANGNALEGGKTWTAKNTVDSTFHNGTFTFGPIIYTEVGTHYYLIDEVENGGSKYGINYDPAKYIVTVVVEDDNEGGLKTTVTVDGSGTKPIVYNNRYVPNKASNPISGDKVLEGKVLGEGDFQFQLYKSDASWAELGAIGLPVSNGDDGKFSFPAIEYTTEGTHYYLVKEVNGGQTIKGVTYDDTVFRVKVDITDDQRGQLHAKTTVYDDNGIPQIGVEFVNTYAAESTTAQLEGTKIVKDKITGTESKPADGAYTFELYNAVPGTTAGSYVKDGDALQTKKNDAEGKFLFDEISLADTGTYYFIVVEHNDGQYDIAYDTTEYLVTVTVIDEWNGKLKVDSIAVTGGDYDTVHFVNVYDPTLNEKAGQVVIDVTKYLDMKSYTHVLLGRDGYEFHIQGINNGYFESSFSNEDGKAFFTLKFTEDDIGKTFTYEITEFKGSKADIVYSEAKHTVSVTVGVDGTELTTKVTVNGTLTTNPAVSFTNIYDPTLTEKEVEVDVDVTKELINDYSAVIGKDGFKFQLVNKADATDKQTVTSNAQGKAVFNLKFTENDINEIFTYEISEIDTGIADIDYSGKTYTLTVAVSLNTAGQLIATVKLDGTETTSPAVTFTNEYDPTNTSKEETVTIYLTKEVENRYDALIGRDGFKFQLVNKNDATDILYAVSDANGKASFTKKYTEQDIGKAFTYELTEVAVTGNDIDYSTQKFVFVITVDVNAKGELIATVEQDGTVTSSPAVTFTNTYDPTNTPKEKDVTVDVTKVVENRYAAMIGKDGFQFQLVNQADATDILTAASNTNGKAFFKLKYTEKDIGKTFTYEISEIGISGNDIDYSTAKYTLTVTVNVNEKGELIAAVKLDGTATNSPAVTFTNTYDPTNTPKEKDVTIDVTKVLVNEYTTVLGKNGFKFQLVNKADAADILYAVSNADGKASFTKKYTEKDIGKTFTYELTEVDTKLADIIYSTAKYTVTVAVDVDAQGKLVTAVKLDGKETTAPAVSFTNTYDPKNTEKETEVKIDVTKVLENKYATVLGKGGFKFLLTDKVSGAAQEALSNTEGKAVFTLKYTEQDIGKTVTYELTEADTKLADIIYSAAKYTVTVAVDVDAQGKLVTAVKLDGKETTAPAVSFTNTYDPKLTDKKTEVRADVTKILNNKTATAAALSGFKFQIVDTGSNTAATAETGKDGNASFLLTFTQQHIGNTYTYQLTEVNTGIEGMTYDETVYTFTVAVDVDAEGKLTTALTVNGQAAQKLEASFTNTYDGPPVTPSTGDNAQLTSWILLMILCAAAVTVLLVLGKRKHLI